MSERSSSAIDAVTANTARALLKLRGETQSRALAELLVMRYRSLDDDQRTTFFRLLLDEFGAERGGVDAAIEAYRADPTEANTVALAEAADSNRLPLFRALNTAAGGIEVLLDMRSELLTRRRTHPELAPVERDLKYLLDSWFNRGFLELRQLDWQTPAHILESLIRYEAVHEIRGWDDLRRRLAPDRRSFGFFHPALPDEPIIFVEVALVHGLAASIQDVIDAPTPDEMPADVDTAIFYSITNCQTGLRGISFGSFLIKQVTERLSGELPQLTTFSTLSPIPGFSAWLLENHGEIDTGDAQAMEAICGAYLVGARRRGLPLDPVARFHLRNGACVERINWMGDTSDKGMAESHGLLVNYLYSGQDLADNHDALTLDGVVTASPNVLSLIGSAVPASSYRVREPIGR
ncbi:MAG: malonyl-CoA decarboxylase [Actinomycetota bacterium]